MVFGLAQSYYANVDYRHKWPARDPDHILYGNHDDQFYDAEVKVKGGIYDINGFEVQFFSEKETLDLIAKQGFKMIWMKEEYEKPLTPYLVAAAIKNKKN